MQIAISHVRREAMLDSFGQSFTDAFTIHRALNAMAARVDGRSRLVVTDVAAAIRSGQPDLTMSDPELQQAIIRAAADAGIEIWIG